jgi:hypothetical protein
MFVLGIFGSGHEGKFSNVGFGGIAGGGGRGEERERNTRIGTNNTLSARS